MKKYIFIMSEPMTITSGLPGVPITYQPGKIYTEAEIKPKHLHYFEEVAGGEAIQEDGQGEEIKD